MATITTTITLTPQGCKQRHDPTIITFTNWFKGVWLAFWVAFCIFRAYGSVKKINLVTSGADGFFVLIKHDGVWIPAMRVQSTDPSDEEES